MATRDLLNLNSNKRLFRAIAGLLAFSLPVVFGLIHPIPSCAQADNSGPVAPAFEAASVKPDGPHGMFNAVSMMFGPDSYSASNVTLRMLIKDAYGVENNQLLGGADWIGSAKYEIEARIDSDTAYRLSKLSEEQRKIVQRRMLQGLLADRFKLTIHDETKELLVYWLVLAKNGPKFHQAKPGDTYANGLRSPRGNLVGPHMMLMKLGGGSIAGQGVPLEYLVQRLSSELGLLVLDKTGLTGNYDFSLEWTPDRIRAPVFSGAEDQPQGNEMGTGEEAPGPSLFTALQEQLGVKLEAHKGPVDVLVIDHVERPSAN